MLPPGAVLAGSYPRFCKPVGLPPSISHSIPGCPALRGCAWPGRCDLPSPAPLR